MKLIIRVAMILMLVSINGCGNGDPNKASDTKPFNAQLKTLEQSKQVERAVQDAAEQQRQKIEQEAQ